MLRLGRLRLATRSRSSTSNIVWDNGYLRQMQSGRREVKPVAENVDIDFDFISDVEKGI